MTRERREALWAIAVPIGMALVIAGAAIALRHP
jgi:hypothetical protein